ncbi:MAG TPA: two-component regulator propeller domain-containing protein [Bacteroidales bacterium]|nr:two-component regulator propeller domain-containing protein [Bacteroidales bacterium]
MSAQTNYFRQYGNSDGLRNLFIYSINQGNGGYLWIGTADGLYRYDGFDFRYFTVTDSLAGNFVTLIHKDYSGDLWIGHMNEGITHIRNGRFTRFSDTSAVHSPITSVAESDTGTMWFSTQSQGFLVYNREGEMTKVTSPFIDDIILNIKYLNRNQFLVGTQEKLYILSYVKETSSMIIKKMVHEYPASKVAEILKIGAGKFLVFSRDKGIYLVTAKNDSIECKRIEISGTGGKYTDNIQGALRVGKNEIWVNTTRNGIMKFMMEEGGARLISSGILNTKNGLKSNNVKCMFEDSEGNIWLGMFGEGLMRLISNNIKFMSYKHSASTDLIYGLSEDSLHIWMATDKNIAQLSPETGLINNLFTYPRSLTGDRVNSIYCSKNGLIYIGFEKEGLYTFNPSKNSFVKNQLSSDMLENSVKYLTGEGRYLWIGTRKGACRLNTVSGTKKWFNKSNGLPNNDIQEIYIDHEGRKLIATTCNKIYYINSKDSVETLENTSSFGLNSIMAFEEDNSGSLWVATYGNGIFRFGKNGNLNYTVASGLISDYCYSMMFDKTHRLFIGHRGGISQINTESGKIRNYNYNEGIESTTEFYPNCALTDNNRRVWFGTSNGITILSSGTGSGGMSPPVMHIDAVYVNKKRVDFDNTINLKPGNYEIRIEYTGINLSNPDNVTYQTMLTGYSSGWSEVTSRRSVTYEKVSYGQYEFKLKAFNENFIPVKKPLTINFKISKPVYLSFWFYLALTSILIFSLFEFIRIRERTLKSIQKKLLKNLDEKTKEVIVKEEIIKERQKNEKILIAAKEKAELSDKLKTSFLTNISHEIRTPMNAIVGSSELLKSGSNTEEEKNELLNLIVSNSNSLIGMIDDILDISKIESNQLKIHIADCAVYPMLREIYKKYSDELKAREKGHLEFHLSYDPDYDDLNIKTDETRLRQVLGKLLDNAIKFTDNGSINFGSRVETDKIIFFVEDTGIGMSEDKQKIIFDLFRKVDDDKLRLYRGTGMGLALSQSLVRLMGGIIKVESQLNKGSRFYFILPLVSTG